MNPLQVTPTIAADRFPVSILVPDGDGYALSQPKARVILTAPDDAGFGRLIAWTSPEAVVWDVSYDRQNSTFGPKSQDWFVFTDHGEIVIRPLGGCGCGDRLKHWTPEQFQPYRLGRPLR